MFYQYYGPERSEETEPIDYDHHCPLMGSGLNCLKVNCDIRQKDKNQKTCYKGCSAPKIMVGGEHHKKNGLANKGAKTDMREKVYALLKEGLSIKEIALRVSRADSTIRSYRTDLGLGR